MSKIEISLATYAHLGPVKWPAKDCQDCFVSLPPGCRLFIFVIGHLLLLTYKIKDNSSKNIIKYRLAKFSGQLASPRKYTSYTQIGDTQSNPKHIFTGHVLARPGQLAG